MVAVIGLISGPALGEWSPGDGCKMHFPQLPDLSGWDISLDLIADDWTCTQTGPIAEVDLWISWKDD